MQVRTKSMPLKGDHSHFMPLKKFEVFQKYSYFYKRLLTFINDNFVFSFLDLKLYLNGFNSRLV